MKTIGHQLTLNQAGTFKEIVIMISFKRGNLLEDNSEAIINTVNCVGVMGKGIALQFKKAFPGNFKAYKKACDKNQVVPGKMYIYKLEDMFTSKWIINFPTKRHWKGKSKIEDIESGLHDLALQVHNLGIKSIAIPPLGSGLGGLEWSDVRDRIIKTFEHYTHTEINIYEPIGSPSSKTMPIRTKKPRMTHGRALLIKLLQLYAAQDYEYTKLEIQKLAYFLQESGLDLKLKYKAHDFGPYADNLHHVLNDIDGHYIKGYGDGVSRSQITLVDESISKADAFLEKHNEVESYLERVGSLIEGYETPLSLEVLSTVHWAAKYILQDNVELDGVKTAIFNWSDRKKRFKEKYIEKAYNQLTTLGWIASDSNAFT